MKITLVQSRGIINDPKVNFFKARMRINNVDSEIFIFPELFCSGYTNDQELMRIDSLQSTIVNDISTLSDNKGCTVICGCPRKIDDSIYDSAIVIDGKEFAYYDKINLYKNGLFDETELFKAGSKPLIVEREGLKMGIVLGHDLYVHNLCRYYAENGADMIISMSSLLPKDIDAYLKVAQAMAIQYGIPIMICNMTGNDCGEEMGGKSAFIDVDGTFLEQCTSGSDVREIRIDIDEFKAKTAKRFISSEVTISDGETWVIKNLEADPNGPLCPFAQ